MSAQCWCYTCAGKIVVRSTFVAHGRKNKPDEPIRAAACLPMVSMPESDAHAEHEASDEETDSSDDDDIGLDRLGLNAPVDEEDCFGKAKLSAPELTLFLLDWMCTHKATDPGEGPLVPRPDAPA